MFDFIGIRGSHQDFTENLSIAPANAIFHNEKRPLIGILRSLFLKTTPVNYRIRRMINNRWIKQSKQEDPGKVHVKKFLP